MEMAMEAVAGRTDSSNFILKIVFTALTLSAGFKGGEIVPTFCVGATIGWFMGASLGLPLELAAALGLIGLFCAVTGSPLASIFLSVELFGSAGIGWFIPLCIIAFAISNRRGLYSNKPCEIFTSILKEKYK